MKEQIRSAWETRLADPGQEDDDIPGEFRFGLGRTTEIHDVKTSHRLFSVNNLRDLVRILRERSRINQKRELKTDLLYYANRNKYGSALLIPRRSRVETPLSGKVVILLDVSGSVPVQLVRQVVAAISNAEGTFNAGQGKRQGRLIAWSDSLCSDVPLNELDSIQTGGGTLLANGIRYCERYLDTESAFFIISDFQDDLAQWLNAARDLPGRRTAIGYGKTGRQTGDSGSLAEWFALVGSNGDYRKEAVSLENFVRVFDTLIIRNY